MPEITLASILIIAAALLLGIILGWIFRGRRGAVEKTAINLGWQEQLEAQRREHERLLEQNKSLMEQNSQYQASNKDSKMRAGELSAALKEAFERRDELQRQIKDIRSNLEATVAQRNQLQSDIQSRAVEDDATSTALQKRDEQIARLRKELDSWQERVPPLVERFRTRNEQANALETELLTARERIAALEAMLGSDQTRVEPVDPGSLGDDLNASNDALDATTGDAAADDDAETAVGLLRESEDCVAADARQDDAAPAARYEDEDEDVDEAVDNEAGTEEIHNAPQNVAAANAVDSFAARDDLMQIKGVGPAIAKTLHELGIYQFEQIAAMSEFDIDRVAERLKGFRSRIYREDWIGQARALLDQKLSGSA